MMLFDKDLWQEIYLSLSQNKLRTFLTAFGVLWGIFMLLTMLGGASGITNAAEEEWGDFAVNSLFVSTSRTTMPYAGYKRGRWYSFHNEDVSLVKKHFPQIETISGGVWYNGANESGNVVVYGKEAGSFVVFGESPDRFRISPMHVVAGRTLNWRDLDEKRKIVVIGIEVANTLFKNGEEAIGKYIKINDVYFLVVGMFKSMHSGNWADWENRQMFMPRTTSQQVFNLGDRISWLTISVRGDTPASDMIGPITALLSKKYKIHPDDRMAFDINDISKNFRQAQGLFLGINLLTWIMGGFTLMAGVIGIGNIMLIAVKERTKEIGVRRAVGAKPWQIAMQLMLESMLLTIVSGYAGLLMGIGAVELMGATIGSADGPFRNPHISLELAFCALLILSVSGLIAGVLPASTALKIKPIEALRD